MARALILVIGLQIGWILPAYGVDSLARPHQQLIGKPAPNFRLEDKSGKVFQLSDFKGNVVFLNFWASWCPPCREEFPDIQRMNGLLKTKAFSVIAVSVDDTWTEIDDFLKTLSFKPNFLILRDLGKRISRDFYGTIQFPESYLIDPQGIVREKFLGPSDWASPEFLKKAERLLAKKTQ